MSAGIRCAVCAAAFDGVRLTPQQLAEYNASKLGRRGDVSFLRVPPPEEIQDAQRFTLRSLIGEVVRAIGLTKPVKEEPESKKTARRKSRGRIFENQDIGEAMGGIGSMSDIDQALQKGKD